jgi:flagellum-specific peptidoglycan hydrolase FlgJ
VQTARKARWQQATALVSLSTAGAVTGFSFAHGTVADLTSPTSVPIKLLSSSRPATSAAASDSALRAAIVKAAQYYLRLAQNQSPSEMEALIWQHDSLDGVDHGESCAAFASLVLESGAQATGQQSWVTGGTTYPWPVHSWVDSRVDPNPQSPGIISLLQDAEAHNRWHPLGDGYTPRPGDWVLFDGHVEVVTKYAGGVLYTIGGDSMPNMSVNAHQYNAPLAAQGVQGFVNNGMLLSAVSQTAGGGSAAAPAQGQPTTAQGQSNQGQSDQGQSNQVQSRPGQADVPGLVMPALSLGGTAQASSQPQQAEPASTPAARTELGSAVTAKATIPGSLPVTGSVTSYTAATPSLRYSRSQAAPSTASVSGTSGPGTASQQAFIDEIAPGALAAQKQYGIPAAVTIAQAIDESGWGQSQLARQDNNLFGIKGTGPAGSVLMPTQEFENGQWVTISAPFRVYSSVAQSISDHTLLLATGSAYQQAMADRRSPDAFANDLTGVYATDPNYGASLISIMRQYNLYRFDSGTSAGNGTSAAPASGQSTSRESSSAQSTSGQSATGQSGSGRSGSPEGTSPQSTSPQSTSPQSSSGRSPAGQSALIPGTANVNSVQAGSDAEGSGGASIPGLDVYAGTAAAGSAVAAETSAHLEPIGGQVLRAGPRNARVSTRRYATQMPRIVTTDFITTAKTPLLRAKPLYQDVAGDHGIRWELLAACDWMQCRAQPRVSPVHGEKLGTRNGDGTVYRSKSEALDQVAADLIELASLVYGVNLRQRLILSIRDLANVFAAFRWGGLLKAHRISAMEFPYSVAGLTDQHMKMRWPDIGEAAPDKPGTRFRMSFGAVPVVLGLSYPATA